MTKWKDIEGFEGLYKVSNDGFVKRCRRRITGTDNYITATILKPSIVSKGSQKGMFKVELRKDGKRYNGYVHLLVAKAFIPNPYNYLDIIHLNGCLIDNRVENLAWIDRGYKKSKKLYNNANY